MMQDQETVLLQGHIIDSLILAKVLDTILMMGGTFDIQDLQIGKTREEPSRAKLTVRASSAKLLSEILHAIQPHGASGKIPSAGAAVSRQSRSLSTDAPWG